MQSYGAWHQWIHLQNIRAPEGQGVLLKKDKKYKSQRVREFAVRLCLLGPTSEATPIMSHQEDFTNLGRTRMILIDKLKWTGEYPSGLNPTQN